MPLDISALNTEAMSSDVTYPLDFIDIIVDQEDTEKNLFLTNHYKDLTVISKNYKAAGELIGFEGVSDDIEVKDNDINLSLSGVNQTFTAVVLSNPVEGSLIRLYRGFWDKQQGVLVDAPYLRWSGLVNSLSIGDDYTGNYEDSIIINVSCKSTLTSLLERTNGRYTSISSFQVNHSNDTSMEFVPAMGDYNPQFGREQ